MGWGGGGGGGGGGGHGLKSGGDRIVMRGLYEVRGDGYSNKKIA